MTARCEICGRFISNKDFVQGKALSDYGPLSGSIEEEVTHWHLDCETDNSRDHGIDCNCCPLGYSITG